MLLLFFCFVLIFVFPDEKREKTFADVEEVKQKMAEAPKVIKIDKFRNCFELQEKRLNRCMASNGEGFEGDWFKHVRINTQFLISKFCLFLPRGYPSGY